MKQMRPSEKHATAVATKPATTEGAVGEDAGVFAQVNLWVS